MNMTVKPPAVTEPARLIRYVDPHEIGGDLCHYDEEHNLILVNKELFEELTPQEKKRVLRTRRSL